MFPGKAQAKAVLEIAQIARPTLFFSVPTLYAQMLQEAERESYSLESVRLAVSAAEPLPAEIFRRWHRRFGVEILDGIGSTEVLHIYLSARLGKVKPGSTGSAVPGYTLRIVDPDDREVPPGTIGDLLVAGNSIASGYWNRRQLTLERMRGKWFFTGDKYWMDQEGYYWYAGRCDEMFRVSGQWVSPVEVERMAKTKCKGAAPTPQVTSTNTRVAMAISLRTVEGSATAYRFTPRREARTCGGLFCEDRLCSFLRAQAPRSSRGQGPDNEGNEVVGVYLLLQRSSV